MLYVAAQAEAPRLIGSEDTLEQVYTWSTRENPKAGIYSDADMRVVGDQLIRPFAPDRNPGDRTLTHLRATIDALAPLAQDPARSSWSAAQTPGPLGEDSPLWLHGLHALVRHLDWVHAVFRDVPGASVTVQ